MVIFNSYVWQDLLILLIRLLSKHCVSGAFRKMWDFFVTILSWIVSPKDGHPISSGFIYQWKNNEFLMMALPIGSMYAIYGDIYHQYTPNVSIYTIHGSYGLSETFYRISTWEHCDARTSPQLKSPSSDLAGRQSQALRQWCWDGHS